MNPDTLEDVVVADREMERPTKEALKELTDLVEHWGATRYHRHVIEVRQQVETDLTGMLGEVLDQLDASLAKLAPLVAAMASSEPQDVISRELASLRSQLDSWRDLRGHLTAEGLGRTAASVARGLGD